MVSLQTRIQSHHCRYRVVTAVLVYPWVTIVRSGPAPYGAAVAHLFDGRHHPGHSFVKLAASHDGTIAYKYRGDDLGSPGAARHHVLAAFGKEHVLDFQHPIPASITSASP